METRGRCRRITAGIVDGGILGDGGAWLMDADIVLENVTVNYDRRPAIHHISGRFASGSLTAIAGPNGGGKSTLLKVIAGILFPSDGRIAMPETMRRQLAYMPQTSEIQRDFPITPLHLVASGHWRKTGMRGAITPTMLEAASQALATVGLRGFEHRPLAGLSSGQFQRALFARLLVQDAPLILLDEPFTAIDADTTQDLLDIVRRWHREGRTVICILHDFSQIRAYFPQCLLIAQECIGWGAPVEILQPERLMSARMLHQAWNLQPEFCTRS